MWSSFNPFSNPTPSTYSTTTGGPSKLLSSLIIFSILGLIGFWSWMLLMTAVYFHTPFEKFTGLLTGIVFWWLLPKEA